MGWSVAIPGKESHGTEPSLLSKNPVSSGFFYYVLYSLLWNYVVMAATTVTSDAPEIILG